MRRVCSLNGVHCQFEELLGLEGLTEGLSDPQMLSGDCSTVEYLSGVTD